MCFKKWPITNNNIAIRKLFYITLNTSRRWVGRLEIRLTPAAPIDLFQQWLIASRRISNFEFRIALRSPVLTFSICERDNVNAAMLAAAAQNAIHILR